LTTDTARASRDGRQTTGEKAAPFRTATPSIEDLHAHRREAAEFDTRVPHALANAADQPTELLIIFSRQGERVHLKARTP
jgi:hypothetical protein